ncbi:VOC family protein [Sphingobacterium faecale]|uniref:VOC family protein n=1 Tax=Sphingobacterium faecale TaxID=2803775 RepID=A0ABS1R0A3_9SPHI|nr:VOC family protein [Sphingobacterium faecale]MBL1407694.1 VOC family protein [Sphingobacterium faecale]
MIKFKYTILYVADVTQAISFYERTFQFQRKFITPENDYGELDTGDTTISFASHTLASKNIADGFITSDLSQSPLGIELGITTDTVEELVQQALHNGATLVASPAHKTWGQTVAYIRDIDGFLIEICTPIS